MFPESNFQVVPVADVPKDDVEVSASRKPVVLVADDERVIADTLAIILNQCGFSAHAAYDGVSALELAKEIIPEMVISDVVMPKMTGIGLAKAVIELFPGCKILLFSGQAATSDLLHKAEADGYNFTMLFKPIHPADILRRAKAHFPEEEFRELEYSGSSRRLG
jgi:DNA-binding NtrC family response regulator